MSIIEAYLEHDISHGITIIFVCCILVISAALIDMWTGIDAAKANREAIRSHSLRKTIRKVVDYFRVIIFGVFIDILGLFFPWYDIPYACIIATLGTIIIEGRSVIENLKKKKSHATEVIEIISKIVECANEKDAKKLIDLIKNTKNINIEQNHN